MATGVHVTIDRAAIERLTKSGGGTVQQAVLRMLNRARSNAVARCPGPGNSIWVNPPPGYPTGYLRSHIAYRETGVPGSWELYDDAEYAVFVHEGTRYMIGRPFLMDALTEEINRL